jgi:hypothetical protein
MDGIAVFEVESSSISPARFRSVLRPARFDAFEQGVLRARERVRDEFTSPRSLLDYLRLIQNVIERSRVRATA